MKLARATQIISTRNLTSSSLLYCFDHEDGGDKHILSSLTKAHVPGIRFFAQMSGFVWRQPTVCFSVSPGRRGSLNALSFLIVSTFCFDRQPMSSTYLSSSFSGGNVSR